MNSVLFNSVSLDRSLGSQAESKAVSRDPLSISASQVAFAALGTASMLYEYVVQPALSKESSALFQTGFWAVNTCANLALTYTACRALPEKSTWQKGALIGSALAAGPALNLLNQIPGAKALWDLSRVALVAKKSFEGIKRSYDHFTKDKWNAAKHFAVHSLSLATTIHQTKETLIATAQAIGNGFYLLGQFPILPSARAEPLEEAMCLPLEAAQKDLKARVDEALQNGGRLGYFNSNSGMYRVLDQKGETIAFFKPWDERNGGPYNRISANRNPRIETDEYTYQHKTNSFEQGRPHIRQLLAQELDSSCFAKMPVGLITSLSSDAFVNPACPDEGCPRVTVKKRGFLQEFAEGATSLSRTVPEFDDMIISFDQAYDYRPEQINRILDKAPLRELQKIGILDLLLYNEDRNINNILYRLDGAGTPHLFPIDHESILPYRFQKIRSIFDHPRTALPFCEESRAMIDSLDPETIYHRTSKSGLAPQAAINSKVLAMTLKKFAAAGKTLSDIYQYVSLQKEPKKWEDWSHLWQHMLEARNEATARLPSDERSDLDYYEHLRWMAFQGKVEEFTPHERGWIEAYEAGGDRMHIEGKIENFFWSIINRKIDNHLKIDKSL